MKLPAELACAAGLVDDHPDSIRRLRRLVVALAITGRLTEERNCNPAPSEQLDQLDARHRDLVADGKLPRAPVLRPIAAADLPDVCPPGPLYLRLGDVAQIEKGRTGIAGAVPGPYPLVVTAQDRGSCDHFDIDAAAAIVPLVSSAGHGKASLQRLHYQEGKFALGTILAAVIPHAPDLVSARFIFEYLTSFKDELLVSQMIGTANVTLTIGKVANTPIPLVAHTVQQRVEELMALCDRLEAARAEREAARDRLTAASLARLNAPDPETFSDDARFALDALPAMSATNSQVAAIRQTILNLAVSGRLVRQQEADQPATLLLARIAEERRRLIDAGGIPRPKPAKRDSSWLPAGLPSSWEPAALGELCSLVTSGSRGWGDYYADEGPNFVRAQNIRFGRLRLHDLARVNPPDKSEGSRTQVAQGDLLVVITGAGVTNPALLDRDLGETYVSQHVALLRPVEAELSPWLLLCLMAPAGGRAELVKRAYGSGKPGLNLDNLRCLTVPIPPLAEQQRLVAKVNELMALCDQLETSLNTATEHRSRLLAALLQEVLDSGD